MTSEPPPGIDRQDPPPSSAPPSGWYRNPDGDGRRWWDGQRWTEHVELGTASNPGGNSPRDFVQNRWPVLAGAAVVLAVTAAAIVLLLSGRDTESSDVVKVTTSANELSAEEAATVLEHAKAIRTYCLKDGYGLGGYGFVSNRAEIAAEGRAAEGVQALKALYREHPDASLPNGVSMRQVIADTVTVLTIGGTAGKLSIQSNCAPGDADILQRELSATP